MDPRPTTYNACKKGREKGFKDTCIPTCTSILGENGGGGGTVELKSKLNPKPNSFAACDGSKNKKRRPNNPFARCRRAYEIAFEETQKGIAERAKAALAATEDVELRQQKDPGEDRPTPYQVPPTDVVVVEEAIEPDDSTKEEEDEAVVESTANVIEAVVEEPANAKALDSVVDEANVSAVDSEPIGTEALLDQSDARANGPTGPAADKDLPKEESATDGNTIGPTGAENIHHDSPPGMNGPAETVSGSLSSDNDDNDHDGIDSSPPGNHVSVDLKTTPIVDL